MKVLNLFKLLLAASLLCVAASAAGVPERFAGEGLSFEYPEDWALEDRSDAQSQRLVLKSAHGPTHITVIARREPVLTPVQLQAAHEQTTTPLAEELARQLGRAGAPLAQHAACLPTGNRPAMGYRFKGQLDGREATGEVYSLVLGHRLISLVRVGPDADEARNAPAWRAVRDTLKVEPPAGLPFKAVPLSDAVTGGALNGKALKRVMPRYPRAARPSGAAGPVSVEVVVDEKGDVVSAQAVSGPEPLRDAAEEAAREWKFSPTTVCELPVKVRGRLVFNFALH